MNNKEKFTTSSSKSKVYRENSETISSCPVKFFTDVLFPSLVSFAFFFLKIKKYILIHIQLSGQASDKNFFTRPISRSSTTFFGLIKNYLKKLINLDGK